MEPKCRICNRIINKTCGFDLVTEFYRYGKEDLLLADMLLQCTSVNVLEDGQLSQIEKRKFLICTVCKSDLIVSYNFRIQCLESLKPYCNKTDKSDTNINTTRNDTKDIENNKYSAVFLIDTDEIIDDPQPMDCDNNQDTNLMSCDDNNKENFHNDLIDDKKDEIEKINDYIKFCARTSGMTEEDILSIIDNETPDIGEVVVREEPKGELEKEISPFHVIPKKIDEEIPEKYKNTKTYTKILNGKSSETEIEKVEVLEKMREIGTEELLKEQQLIKEKQEEANKQIEEYLNKKEKMLPSSLKKEEIDKQIEKYLNKKVKLLPGVQKNLPSSKSIKEKQVEVDKQIEEYLNKKQKFLATTLKNLASNSNNFSNSIIVKNQSEIL